MVHLCAYCSRVCSQPRDVPIHRFHHIERSVINSFEFDAISCTLRLIIYD